MRAPNKHCVTLNTPPPALQGREIGLFAGGEETRRVLPRLAALAMLSERPGSIGKAITMEATDMPNNYGMKTRDLAKAGRFAMNRQARISHRGYSGAATQGDRWARFANWAKESGIKWAEDVTREHVQRYGRELAFRVEEGDLAPATAQNYVSAVNTVMAAFRGGEWQAVTPVGDCNIPKRSSIREEAPSTLDRRTYAPTYADVRVELGTRAAAITALCREIGLRSEESSKIDARAAYNEAVELGVVRVICGSKGGQEREIAITSSRQIEALALAAEVQGRDRSLIPSDQSWEEWREGGLRELREFMQTGTGDTLHDLRSAYACERYEQLTGQVAPVVGGVIEDRESDREARLQIAEELGHHRIEVVASYVGGRR